MSPRQLLRLFESRRSESFDDQKTPAEIATSETVSANHQEFLEYVLSQIRQILGTDNWHDEVPVNLETVLSNINDSTNAKEAFIADCLATDSIGDCVYCTDDPIGGIYQVTKCNPYVLGTLPSVGIIRAKTSATRCEVQYAGEMSGVYGSLDRTKPVFIGFDDGLTQTVPAPNGGPVYVQQMGKPLAQTIVLVRPNDLITKRVS